jgi:hypothetical protein
MTKKKVYFNLTNKLIIFNDCHIFVFADLEQTFPSTFSFNNHKKVDTFIKNNILNACKEFFKTQLEFAVELTL